MLRDRKTKFFSFIGRQTIFVYKNPRMKPIRLAFEHNRPLAFLKNSPADIFMHHTQTRRSHLAFKEIKIELRPKAGIYRFKVIQAPLSPLLIERHYFLIHSSKNLFVNLPDFFLSSLIFLVRGRAFYIRLAQEA